MNNNKNMCSIFHLKFKNLIKVIPSARKAQLLDYILLGWQTSTYKLKGSNNKWFMKPYSQIVDDTGIPHSTLERYIKQLNDDGFIERRQALYSRTGENGSFIVKKGSYINVTDKLLALLVPATNPSASAPSNEDIHNDKNINPPENRSDIEEQQPNCLDIDKNEGIDPPKMRGLYIRDLHPSFINNIIHKQTNLSVDKKTVQRRIQQFESIQQLFTSEIKEEIPDEIKKLVLGTFFNLTLTHNKQFSSPKQLAAEYLFALLNTEYYLPNVKCFKFRNNILSKIVRSNHWKTPKGFYKHFYLGQDFKDKQELRDLKWQQQKELEMNQSNIPLISDDKDDRLIQIEKKMQEKSSQIEHLTTIIYQQTSEEAILSIRENIQILRKELEDLWEQQFCIEQEMEKQFINDRLCA